MQTTFCPVETKTDICTLVRLAREIWEQHFTPIIGAAQVDYMLERFLSESALEQQMGEGYRYFLFQVEGDYVGFTGIHEQFAEKRMFLSKLYVRQSMRGRGIAREAFTFLNDLCKQQGFKTIWLTVNRNNTNTIDIYRHLGFVTVREQKADIGNGFYMDDYIMEYAVR